MKRKEFAHRFSEMLAQCSPYTGAWSKPLPEACDLFFVAASPRKPDDLSVNPRQLNKVS